MHSATAQLLLELFADEGGVTAIEYGLMGTLITVAIVVGVGAVGASLAAIFDFLALSFAAAV